MNEGMTLYIELEQHLEQQLRKQAMEQFGYTKGALKEAVQEAVEMWLISKPFLDLPKVSLTALQGLLKNVKADSVTLKHNAAGLFTK